MDPSRMPEAPDLARRLAALTAMGFERDQVFIGNILKCRPPDNRQPLPEEMETCMPYLKAQIAALQPKVIIALGGTAAKGLLGVSTGITKLRGSWMSFEGIDLIGVATTIEDFRKRLEMGKSVAPLR